MSRKPSTTNESCLNKYTSVFPLYILYASKPVALYTTSNEVSASNTTKLQIYLSPRVRLSSLSPASSTEGSCAKSLSAVSLIILPIPKREFQILLFYVLNHLLKPPHKERSGGVLHNAFTA